MRTATFPAVRTSPETRALVESALRPGETLSTFIEETVKRHALWRKEDEVFYRTALERSEQVKSGTMQTVAHAEVMQGLAEIVARKKSVKKPGAATAQKKAQ